MTIAGVTLVIAPMWRCQADSQSKVWNGVQSAISWKSRQTCSTLARSSCADRMMGLRSAKAVVAGGRASAMSVRACTMVSAACPTIRHENWSEASSGSLPGIPQ
jgi:hypothetical protein